MREAGENGAGGIEGGDFERSWLLGADDPGAEVRFQRAPVLVAVLDDGEVLDLGCGPAGGDEGRVAGSHLARLGRASAHHRVAVQVPRAPGTAERVVEEAAAMNERRRIPAAVLAARVGHSHGYRFGLVASVAREL